MALPLVVVRLFRTTIKADTISAAEARAKALEEYRKYQVRTLTPVEQAYIAQLKQEAKKTKG